MSVTLQALLKLAASPAELVQFASDLTIAGAPAVARSASAPDDDAPEERAWLSRDGVATAHHAARGDECAALVRAVDALAERDLPASFVYAFDEPWAIGEHLRARISTLLGHDYELVEDVWAWRIAPGSGGWPPHRGISHVGLDRDAPEIINVWVALSDVSAERACMHAVPLDEDPGYPGSLASTDAPLSSVRALPVRAGDALFWNANVLHWGGRCAERAPGPRVSCSFTLRRTDAAPRFPELVALAPLASLDLAARMDVLARMILLYGGADRADVRGVVREWAAVTHELTSRFGGPAGERKAP